jgi:ABC-2 type transport system ATP-binding protein
VQDEFHRLVRSWAESGRTVFLSSHSLDEVQHAADRVGIIREGRLVTVETVDALRARGLRRVTLTVAPGSGSEARMQLERTPGVGDLSQRGDVFDFAVSGAFPPVLASLGRLDVIDLLSRAADLDEVFLALYRGEGE